MEARAGSSVLLSLCIVALATVALYRPDPPQTPTIAMATSVLADDPVETVVIVDDASELPEPTAGIPLPTPTTPPTYAVAVPSPKPPSLPATVEKKIPATRRRSNSAFTTVGVGETLPQIAARVYGTADATETLFRANRDVLSDPGDPLQVGGMLRTP